MLRLLAAQWICSNTMTWIDKGSRVRDPQLLLRVVCMHLPTSGRSQDEDLQDVTTVPVALMLWCTCRLVHSVCCASANMHLCKMRQARTRRQAADLRIVVDSRGKCANVTLRPGIAMR